MLATMTEGGQTWAHQFRMLKQVVKIALSFSLILGILVFAYRMYQLPSMLYQISYYHLEANLLNNFDTEEIEVDSDVWQEINHHNHLTKNTKIKVKALEKLTQPYINYLIFIVQSHLRTSGWITGSCFLIILLFFGIKGKFSNRQRHIAGSKISSAWQVRLRLKVKRQASPIKIGPISLVKGTETQHLLVTGGTGSGKTNCFHHLLPQIRQESQRAVIVDTTGVFIDRYFREGKDIILNPFDERSVSWHPWVECNNDLDLEALAESFIPQTYQEHENYWRGAARSLLISVLQKTAKQTKTTELASWLLLEPLSKLCEFVQGTEAAAHIDLSSEKTAGSVRSVASSFLKCLKFLKNTNEPFSIRAWVQNQEVDDSWLFLSCKPEQRAALNPLIACWFSVATRSLNQMEPNLDRRLWFVLDELVSLNRLRDLESFLSESRKYGGCALLALQSLAQLEAIYGREITQTIIGNCATKIVFAEHDPEIAMKISRAFGEKEIKEYQKGLSYGANDVRDGVNLSLQNKNLPLIPPTAIQALERNEAFVKLPGNIPVVKIKLKIAKI